MNDNAGRDSTWQGGTERDGMPGADEGNYEMMGMGAAAAPSGGRPPLPSLQPHEGAASSSSSPPSHGLAMGLPDEASVGEILTVLSARQRAQELRDEEEWFDNDARPILPKVAFFMGDLRDGLAMLNVQGTFLMSTRNFSQKQVGILIFVFGISTVISMAPIGYLMDLSKNKIPWVVGASTIISFTTVLTAITAQPDGENMPTMILLKVFQGAATAVQTPGLSAITLGIVGAPGFALQVSRNKMMCHIGTALIVCIASLMAYFLYPNIGLLFWVSPLFCFGLMYYIRRIRPEHINTDAARALIITSPTMTEYEHMDEEKEVIRELMEHHRHQAGYVPPGSDATGGAGGRQPVTDTPVPTSIGGENVDPMLSFASSMGHTWDDLGEAGEDNDVEDDEDCGDRFDDESASIGPLAPDPCGGNGDTIGPSRRSGGDFGFRQTHTAIRRRMRRASVQIRRKLSPLEALLNPQLLTFSVIVFLFHLSNSVSLPLVMQSIALDDPQSGILLSGLCIVIAQSCMMPFAKLCGDYSPKWGRKRLFLLGLFSLPVRCVLLSLLASAKESIVSTMGQDILTVMILATQVLDGVGAGIFGTLYILVTNDISGGSGRFSLMMGVTTGAMCLGGMLSGYLGQLLAQDFGYEATFSCLGLISFVPAFMYLFLMPETLPDYAKPQLKKRRRKKVIEMLLNINKRNNFFLMNNSPRAAPMQPRTPRRVRTHLP